MSTKTIKVDLPLQWLRHIVTFFMVLCGAGLTANAHAGYASFVVDGTTGKVLNEVDADKVNHPASLTKMMTLYLTFQALKRGRVTLDEQLPVSRWASDKAPTKLGLRAGSTISVRDCILGMITKSANDAATVVAEKLGGSEPRFVEAMNAQALLLGMTRTHFGSASGLPDPTDGTTARDLSKLAMALYRDFPKQAPFFATQEFQFQGHTIRGHNHLMARYPGMDGLKTGFTDAAGFNLASTAVRNGHRLFGVVMGGRTWMMRDNLMARLLDDGFANRPTPEALVVAAGMPYREVTRRRGTARTLLAALSPIGTAEAESLPAPRARSRHSRRKVVASRRQVIASRKDLASHRRVPASHKMLASHVRHHKAAKQHVVRLACASASKHHSSCSAQRGASSHLARVSTHSKRHAKTVQLASRKHHTADR